MSMRRNMTSRGLSALSDMLMRTGARHQETLRTVGAHDVLAPALHRQALVLHVMVEHQQRASGAARLRPGRLLLEARSAALVVVIKIRHHREDAASEKGVSTSLCDLVAQGVCAAFGSRANEPDLRISSLSTKAPSRCI